MTTTTILPNGTASSFGLTAVGAASIHAALNDSSDSSYIDFDSGADTVTLDFGTFTLPVGAVVISSLNKFRAIDPGGGLTTSAVYVRRPAGSATSQVLTTSAANYTNQLTGTVASQADIDGFQVQIFTGLSAVRARVYEASADITYALVPSVTVSAPTGTITTTTSPTVIWVHTPGSDAPGGQTKYQIRVFTAAQYGIGGFDPATSPAFLDTGQVASSASSAAVGPLTGGTTYRAYVRTAQTTLGTDQWSAYAYPGSNFIINPTTSDIGTVVATADNANGRIAIVVTRTSTTPTWTSIEVQASYDAGATWNYVRGYTRYAIPSAAVTATAATDLVNLTSHGLTAGMTVVFSGLTGGAGLTAGTTYFVIASGLTANAFKVSTTSGGSAVDITTDMTAGSMQSAPTVSLYDYEAPNGVAVIYRARATYQSSGFDIAGAWVSSSAATWSSTADWLKDFRIPSRSRSVAIQSIPTITRDRPQGVFDILGRADPIPVSDVLKTAAGTITLVTVSDTEAADIEMLLSTDMLLLQTPLTDQWRSRYISIGAVTIGRGIDRRGEPTRLWSFPFREIIRPPDTGIS